MAWWPSGILISLLVAVVLGACSGGGGSGRSGRDPVDGMPVGFGGYGSGAGESIEPNGIAVDQANGDVYVVDSNNNRVERFTSRGRFLLAWGWGVADGRTRALQTCMSKCFSGFEGAGAGQLQFAEGVAVDNDPDSASYGDVYVVDLDNRRVQKFSPEGKFLLMFGEEVNQTAHVRNEHASEDVCRASSGDQCKAGPEASVHGLFVFAVEGSFIAVGPNGTVYLGSSDHVLEFNPEGVYQTEITLLPSPKPTGSNELGGVSGLAVNAQGNCKKNSGTASMTSDNLGAFTTLFTECKGPLSTTCTGTGDPSGLIALSGTAHFWLALLGTTLVGALAFLIKEFKFTCKTTGISEEVTVANGCQAALASPVNKLTTSTEDIFKQSSGHPDITLVLPQEATKEIACTLESKIGSGALEGSAQEGTNTNSAFKQKEKAVEVLLMNPEGL